jgi:S1-C subfamily serine protease
MAYKNGTRRDVTMDATGWMGRALTMNTYFEDTRKRKLKALHQAERSSSTLRNKAIRTRIAAATVKLNHDGDGQGVLIRGGYILTAAHCIEWNGASCLELEDFFSVQVNTAKGLKTAKGREFRARLNFLDPVVDIAVLGPVDGQRSWDDMEAFEGFVKKVRGLPLFVGKVASGQSVPVQVLTHKGAWLTGVVTNYSRSDQPSSGFLSLCTTDQIEGGTSGGPVVDFAGRLLGVVAQDGEMQEENGLYSGYIPLAWTALPRRLTAQLADATPKRPR